MDDVWTILLWCAGLVAVLLAAGGVWLYVWLQRPHLPNAAPRGMLTSAFTGDLREQAFLRVFEEYGKTCEVEGFVATCDPELVRTLMVTPAHSTERSRFYKASSVLLYGMSGLLDLDGEKWQRHKSALYPLFHFLNVDKVVGTFHQAVAHHADAWARGIAADDGVLEVDDDVAKRDPSGHMHEDLVAACRAAGMEALLPGALGIDASSPRGKELANELTRYGKHLMRMGDGADGPLLSVPLGVWRVVNCTSRIRQLVKEEVLARFGAVTRQEATAEQLAVQEAAAKKEAEKTCRTPLDGLRAMWLAGFEANEMAAEVNHVYGAHKAAGFTLACALWRAAREEGGAWIRRMRAEWEAELSAAPGDAPRNARTDVPRRTIFPRLVVTSAFVSEVQRLHVVSLCTGRQTGAPLTIDGVTLPTGTEVGVCLQAMHTHPDHFSNPNEFRPGRWLPSDHALHDAGATANPRAFLPFLSGPRKCAGKQLADMELIVGLHAVLDRYDITSPTEDLRMRPDLYASHENTIRFKCWPRTD